MDLRQLRYFVAIAEAGNVREAAARVRVAQSALSRHVRALEDELGFAPAYGMEAGIQHTLDRFAELRPMLRP